MRQARKLPYLEGLPAEHRARRRLKERKMSELSGDPYEGARRAFMVLNPDTTDQDWEGWITENAKQAQGEFDNFEAFARLCRSAISSGIIMEAEVTQLICYAGGYFEGLASMFSSLLNAMPTSGCIPQHERRHARSLVIASAQFQ